MKLTPEEKFMRDSCLSRRKLDSYVFDIALVVISICVFIYGLLMKTDDDALVIVGYTLLVFSIGRLYYYQIRYSPHLESLIHKYEAELKSWSAPEKPLSPEEKETRPPEPARMDDSPAN